MKIALLFSDYYISFWKEIEIEGKQFKEEKKNYTCNPTKK